MTSGMSVIGIDPSLTSTGIVILNGETGSEPYVAFSDAIMVDKTSDSVEAEIKRCDAINDYIRISIEDYSRYASIYMNVEWFAYNARNGKLFERGYLYHSIVKEGMSCCESVYRVAPASLKKYATGSGRADKSSMYNALPEHYNGQLGLERLNKANRNDVVDAFWAAKMLWDAVASIGSGLDYGSKVVDISDGQSLYAATSIV